MNTTKRVVSLERRRLLRKYANDYLQGGDANPHALAVGIRELLDERREMAETIRGQQILLGDVERVLIGVASGYETLRERLHEAVVHE